MLLSPLLAFAAYNNVSLTTAAVVSVGGYTLDVSGSTAALQSITVNGSSFSVTLASGSPRIAARDDSNEDAWRSAINVSCCWR